ncbi:uncharacterized protein DNG_04450 [Cephalotrichum gorgonifer]|uniref:Lysosomal dipeptide transporter MFSD1 n=1 Tax=Cephalotrichum gorgonifer TaxID=2041049 RepID=A0AAE8MWE8_9PEZI|nr:uncharacterized protein DNG_04450 [Cephalotrichum gorgonifer]
MRSEKADTGFADEAAAVPAPSGSVEKGIADIASNSTDESEKHGDFPWSYKLTALVCGLMLSWGSSFSESTLGPLKGTMIKKLKINNAQYGAISSATSLVNSVLPIIGGYGLDHYGVEWGSLACSIAILIGAVISAAGSNTNSFGLVLGGRIVMGFGSTVIETCTSKILAHWFQHRGLGIVYGLDISIGKLIVLAAKASAVPMRDATSFWGWALWIPAIICFVNLLQNIFYVWWAWSRPEWTWMPTGQQKARKAGQRDATRATESQGPYETVDAAPPASRRSSAIPDWKALKRVPRFFWLVVCSQMLQAGVVGGFNGLNADIITVTRGSTEQIAGYTSAIQQVIPVVGAPLVGAVFDFFGYRMLFVSITSVIWILVYCLIGFTQTNALGSMVIASVALTMNALPFLASIPLIVPNQLELGLVFGIWKAFNNCGSVVVDMIAGRLQDITPGKTYERVIAFFVAVKAIEFCLGLFYGFLDRKYLAGILTMSEKKRLVSEQENTLEDPIGRKPAKVFTVVGIGLLATAIMFAFQPLNANADSIRVLVLLPASGTEEKDVDEICCELEHKTLASKPSFEALSYTWGDEPADNPIKVNGHQVLVRKNLYDALQNFRLTSPRALWVDTLCINLADTAERSYQVSMMPYVYSRATKVLAWLGQPENPFTEDQLEAMKTPESRYFMYWSEENCSAVADSPYWTRRWIIQELVLAKEVNFHLGEGFFTIDDYTNLMGDEKFEGFRQRLDLIREHRENRHGDIGRLEILLETFKESQSLDTRDKIFSLLGMADDTAQDMIEVDYGVNYFELYAKLIDYHQASSPMPGRLDVWGSLQVSNPWMGTNYRVYLDETIERSAMLVAFSHLVQEALGGAVDQSRETASSTETPKFYTVRGIFAGKILGFGPSYDETLSSWEANRQWKASLEKEYKGAPNLVELREADAEYSRAILNWDERQLRSIRKVDTAASYGYQHSVDDESIDTGEPDQIGEEDGPQRFRATQGLMGFAPPEAREGDLVYSFWECNVGIIVRKVADDRFMIVGRADLSVETLREIINIRYYSEALNCGTETMSFARSNTEFAQQMKAEAFENMMHFRLDIHTLQMLTG